MNGVEAVRHDQPTLVGRSREVLVVGRRPQHRPGQPGPAHDLLGRGLAQVVGHGVVVRVQHGVEDEAPQAGRPGRLHDPGGHPHLVVVDVGREVVDGPAPGHRVSETEPRREVHVGDLARARGIRGLGEVSERTAARTRQTPRHQCLGDSAPGLAGRAHRQYGCREVEGHGGQSQSTSAADLPSDRRA